jgi:hypothetical protein
MVSWASCDHFDHNTGLFEPPKLNCMELERSKLIKIYIVVLLIAWLVVACMLPKFMVAMAAHNMMSCLREILVSRVVVVST